MNNYDATDVIAAEKIIRSQIANENIRFTQHSHKEMVEEYISVNQALEALWTGRILENYPDHRRGACCLVYGLTHGGRPLHIVCTTNNPTLVVITVYEPKPPKWITATKRR